MRSTVVPNVRIPTRTLDTASGMHESLVRARFGDSIHHFVMIPYKAYALISYTPSAWFYGDDARHRCERSELCRSVQAATAPSARPHPRLRYSHRPRHSQRGARVDVPGILFYLRKGLFLSVANCLVRLKWHGSYDLLFFA